MNKPIEFEGEQAYATKVTNKAKASAQTIESETSRRESKDRRKRSHHM